MSLTGLRSDRLLAENIRILLAVRGYDAKALALWCHRSGAWISKILSGERAVPLKDVGRIADFFGLTASQILQSGISPLTERRRRQRRAGTDRRAAADRRQATDLTAPSTLRLLPAKPTRRRKKNTA